ncbi:MAG TPA: nitroreductase family protein [Candidatus Nanoarchaeia archaeon]|nr:nitroreductase family protein [Candidatus Nanoarchaeia archaeon]
MSDILDVIKSRRTVKNFLPKYVSWENISKVLDAGRHAPSCGNIQNWKFIVVIDPNQKLDLAKATYEQYDIAMASVLIVVCGEPEKAERYFGVRGERLYTVQNCAAAIENMLLEAHSIGLGGAWIGAFDEESVKSICGIPEEIRPQAIVAVGYPKDLPNKPPKYPLEVVVYFHKWRGKSRDPAKYMDDYATIIARKAAAAKQKMQELSQSVVDKAREAVGKKNN